MRLNRVDMLGTSHYASSYRVVQEFVVRSDWVFEIY